MYVKVTSPLARFARYLSTKTCSLQAKTRPIEESANIIRHLQFTNQLPFEKGLLIQEKFVKAELELKELHSKIRRKLERLHQSADNTTTINEHEKKIIDRILAMKPNPIVMTFEFEPAYSGGKRIKKTITPEEIKKYESFVPLAQKENKKPKFVQVERGGQVTFHGPGQMVAYIVLDLKSFSDFPAKCLVSSIETATITTLKNTKTNGGTSLLNLQSETTENTGVWTLDHKKIASVGVHVRRSITSHGVAINVCSDLSYMNNFVMCGLPSSEATSIKEQLPDCNVGVQDISVSFVNEFAKTLGISTVERMQLSDLDVE
ncbi:hypothetical protein HG535_0F04530 [Zygotorulaspora mrakii]|uniref:Octanoyltransferase n=1 Tax=Zygotorulaspora mrakii TaxID=42260 RepID=A0A7H9B5G5_ZYGMR|nr:uncharacterized protein HG535_0F04530 [Zygotorulaspora mrakii]QLG73941.1 hypothetical protein HG535_0F04530 [Zygotorulaspora mrakii]